MPALYGAMLFRITGNHKPTAVIPDKVQKPVKVSVVQNASLVAPNDSAGRRSLKSWLFSLNLPPYQPQPRLSYFSDRPRCWRQHYWILPGQLADRRGGLAYGRCFATPGLPGFRLKDHKERRT